MDVETCRECSRLTMVEQDAIHCTPPPGAAVPRSGAVGSDACVGEAMGFAAYLVDACLPAGAFARSLDVPGHRVAVVVDDALHSMGLVEVAVATAALEECNIEGLVRPISPIHEGAPLALGIERMVRERARALPVVDDQGRVVGLLTDLDALHWVAHRDPRREEP
jgi:CBS domain-containing protein